MEIAEILLGILAVWRVTHLLNAEDGPWDLSLRLRRVAGDGSWARLLDCFYCLSLWVSVPFALMIAASWAEGVVTWLGLSGGAVALDRAMPPEARYREEPPA